MKIAKYFLCLALLLVAISAEAQQLRKEAFDLLNLDYPGLEKVKAACAQQQWDKAAQALLDYYRQRAPLLPILESNSEDSGSINELLLKVSKFCPLT